MNNIINVLCDFFKSLAESFKVQRELEKAMRNMPFRNDEWIFNKWMENKEAYMTADIIRKIYELLQDSAIFDEVVIGFPTVALTKKKSDFVSVDESEDCERNENLGLFVRRSVRMRITVRAYRDDPYESTSIFETIALSDAVEKIIEDHPTLDGVVQTSKLESICSSAEKLGLSYRERVLNYIFTKLDELDELEE